MKYSYWEELMQNPKAKMYYFVFSHIMFEKTGKALVSHETAQNECNQEESSSKLIHVYMLEAAY